MVDRPYSATAAFAMHLPFGLGDQRLGSCSFRVHETDFNDCTLACREAPCGCVTAPCCSPRGGMGSGVSAIAALPLFSRAFSEPCSICCNINRQTSI